MADSFSFEDAKPQPEPFSFEEAQGEPPGFGHEVGQTLAAAGKAVIEHPLAAVPGAAEAIAAGAGGIAESAVTGLAGLGAGIAGAARGKGFIEPAEEARQATQDALDRHIPLAPETEPGKKLTDVLGLIPRAADVAGEKVAEKTGSPALGAATNVGVNVAGVLVPGKILKTVGDARLDRAKVAANDQLGATLRGAGVNPDLAAAIKAQGAAHIAAKGPQHPAVHAAAAVDALPDATLRNLSKRYTGLRDTGLSETEAKAALSAHITQTAQSIVPIAERPEWEASESEAAPAPEHQQLSDLDDQIAGETNKYVVNALKSQRKVIADQVEKREGAARLTTLAGEALKRGDQAGHAALMAEAEKLAPKEAAEAAPEAPAPAQETAAPVEAPTPSPEASAAPEAAAEAPQPAAAAEEPAGPAPEPAAPPTGTVVTQSVGLAGGKSKDGKTTFISRMIPQFLTVENRQGKPVQVPVWDEIASHEAAEYPNIKAKGYDKAHDQDGNDATRAFLDHYDVDPVVYANAMRPHIKAAELDAAQHPENVPPELDHRPYAAPFAEVDKSHLLGEQHPWNKLRAGKKPVATRAAAREALLKEAQDGIDRDTAKPVGDGSEVPGAVSGEPVAGSGEAAQRDLSAEKAQAEELRKPLGSKTFGGKMLSDMSPQELDDASEQSRHKEVSDLTEIFGSDADGRTFQRLAASNSERSHVLADKMEEALPPDRAKMLDDWTFGRGKYAVSATSEDINALRNSHNIGLLDDSSPEKLGQSLRYELTKLGDETDPRKMNTEQLGAYMTLREAQKIIREKGWSSKEVSNATIRAAASRFADPADAEFMLGRFLKGDTDAAKEGIKSSDREQQHPGASQRPAISKDDGEPRQEGGGQAGRGDSDEAKAQAGNLHAGEVNDREPAAVPAIGERNPQGEGGQAPAAGSAEAAGAAEGGGGVEARQARAVGAPLADPRLKIDRYRTMLRAMAERAGWAQGAVGKAIRTDRDSEVVGRTTTAGTEPWFEDAQKSGALKANVNGKATREAVRKALAGEPLSVAERRHVASMIDTIHADEIEHEMAAVRHQFQLSDAEAESARIVAHAETVLGKAAVERISEENDSSDAAFHAVLRQAIDEKRATQGGTGGGERTEPARAKADESAEAAPEFSLEAQTERDIRAREAKARLAAEQEAADRARAEAPGPEGFTLTGSKRDADVGVAAGQKPLFARGAESDHTPNSLRSALRKQVGRKGVDNLERTGKLVIHADASTLPDELKAHDSPNTRALFDPKTGVSHLIADRIPHGDEQATLLHEIGEHAGIEDMLSPDKVRQYVNDLRSLRNSGNAEVKAAWQHVRDNYKHLDENSHDFVREVAARMVESAPKLPWARRLVSEVRAYLYRAGFTKLNADTVRGLAAQALRKAARSDEVVAQTKAREPMAARGDAKKDEPASIASGLAHRIGELRGTAAERGAVDSKEESIARGESLLNSGVDPHKFVADAIANKSNSDDAFAVAAAQEARLERAANQAADRYGDTSKQYQSALDAEQAWRAHVKPMQTRWSEQGISQQGSPVDVTTMAGLRKAYTDSSGKAFTPEQKKEAERHVNDVTDADYGVREAKRKLSESIPKEPPKPVALPSKPGAEWTPEQARALWSAAKTRYFDKGVTDFDDIRYGLAADYGLLPEDVTRGLATSKMQRALTDDLYAKMAERRRVINQAKDWVTKEKYPGWLKAARNVPKFFFSLATLGHGTVGMITHAGNQMFNPEAAAHYWTNFGRQFKLLGWHDKGAYHERMMQDLIRDPNFVKAKRAGLANDPFKYQDDYQNTAAVKFFKKVGLIGNRGFDALKLFRQDRFNQDWERLPDNLKTPDMAQALAQSINHATGVVTKPGKFSIANVPASLMFAPKLEASRWAFLLGDPAKAAKTFANWKNETPEARRTAVMEVKQKALIAGTYLTALAINQGLLSASGSDQKINFTDPKSPDWLSFKGAGHRIGVIAPMVGAIRFLADVAEYPLQTDKELRGDVPEAAAAQRAEKYLRGKLSPFAGIVADLYSGADYNKRPIPVPWSHRKVPGYLKKEGVGAYTPTEYATEHLAPIPFEEAFRELNKPGDKTSGDWADALISAAIVGGTGAHVADDIKAKK